jgi:hypothetical protein
MAWQKNENIRRQNPKTLPPREFAIAEIYLIKRKFGFKTTNISEKTER